MDSNTAWSVLLSAFPGDQVVREICLNQLKLEHPFIGMLHKNPWARLAQSFRGDARVVAAVEEWAQRQQFHDMEIALVSSIASSRVLKEILLRRLESSSFLHWPAGALLDGWGMTDTEVATNLRAIANANTPRASSIAYLIPRILPDPQEARDRLLELLRGPNDRRPDFVLSGLAALPHVPAVDDEIVDLALKRISEEAGLANGRWELIQGWPKHPRVRSFALEALEQPEPALQAVASAYADDAEVRGRVAAFLTPLPRPLRHQILETLTDLESEPDLALDVLSRFRQEDDAEIATAGSIGFHGRIRSDRPAADRALAKLVDDIYAVGPTYETVRQAALAGLVVLERLEEIEKAARPTEPAPFGDVMRHWAPNVQLLRVLAQHWPEVQAAFGVDPMPKLSHSANEWQLLSLVADVSPVLKGEVLKRIQESEQPLRPETLQFLAAAMPGSDVLLDKCLVALHEGSTVDPYPAHQLITVAAIFAQQFAHSDKARERLLTPLKQWRGSALGHEGTVLALVAAWPDDPLVDQLYAELQPERPVGAWPGYAVFYAKSQAAELTDSLQRHLRRAVTQPYLLKPLRSALLQRVTRDDAAREALAAALHDDSDPNLKASVPRLLVAVGAQLPTLRTWCSTELRRQLRRPGGSEIGLDLVAEDARTVVVSLQEALAVGAR